MNEAKSNTVAVGEYKTFAEILMDWVNQKIDLVTFKKLVKDYKFKTA